MSLPAVLEEIDADLSASIERLFELLRIPSISTDPAYAPHCQTAADWLVATLEDLGVEARKQQVEGGHPMVVGHSGAAGPEDGLHVLFYGHYDVQPVDPLELWNHDPFDPRLEDTPKGKTIRARGAHDDKGQLMTFLQALRAYKKVQGRLPCKITFLLEGEEECGSPSLEGFLRENAHELRADLAIVCDTGMFENETPAIVTMLRGVVAEEFTLTTSNADLHSGLYGGIARNPLRELTRILGGLHDETGRITVPGFYDGVERPSDALLAQWEGLGFDHAGFLGEVGLSAPAGELGVSPLEMIWSRPTADVNGIWGGYTGNGFKTVLPAQGHAKVSFRLVSGQEPARIRDAFRQWVRDQLAPDCEVDFISHAIAPAGIMKTTAPAFELSRAALTEEWETPAAYVGCGGSLPVASYLQSVLGMDSLLIGFGGDDDLVHSPNEKYDVKSYHKGTRSWARILDALSCLR